MTRLRPIALLVVLVLVLVATACGGGGSRSTVAPGSTSRLHDLHEIDQLRTAFNTASREPRLIVLVSPT